MSPLRFPPNRKVDFRVRIARDARAKLRASHPALRRTRALLFILLLLLLPSSPWPGGVPVAQPGVFWPTGYLRFAGVWAAPGGREGFSAAGS